MSKGQFESGKKGGLKIAGLTVNTTTVIAIAAAVLAVIVLTVGIIVAVNSGRKPSDETDTTAAETEKTEQTAAETEEPAETEAVLADNVSVFGTDVSGLTAGEARTALSAFADRIETEPMIVRLPSEQTLELNPGELGLSFDLELLLSDLFADIRPGNVTDYFENPAAFRTGVIAAAENRILEDCVESEKFTDGKTTEEAVVTVTDEEGNETRQKQKVDVLNITLGTTRFGYDASSVYNAVIDAYNSGAFETAEVENTEIPPVIPDEEALAALREKYGCKDPVNATYDTEKYEVVPGTDGYGFDEEELLEKLKNAKPGETVSVYMLPIPAEVSAADLEDRLFCDLLGECDTGHTAISARTTNLKLACQEIDGTILLPGEIFSFNKTVGERTAAKGYKEATIYSGGQSVPATGGGVCQVASTIYSACLYADLKIVESTPHQFFCTYTNPGMDSTIYWGSLDFKFKNDTDYPLRIDASVHDGRVWIELWGTNTKDYTVKMEWQWIATQNYETVEQEVKEGDEHKPGDVITTPYTGYTYDTYMVRTYTDGRTERIFIRRSVYSKRDRVIAVAAATDPSETEPTDPSETEPTDPKPTDPTDPPETEPTDPPSPPETEPTDPPSPPETEPAPPDAEP